VTEDPIGVEAAHMAPDGRIVWWQDDTGTERGHWVAAPFAGGQTEPLVRGVPDAWSIGLSFARDRVAVGLADEDGHAVYAANGDRPARLLFRDERPTGLGRTDPQGTGGLSSDGRLVDLRHAEDGDITRYGLQVLDAQSGEAIGAVRDDRGSLDPVAWSPAAPRENMRTDYGCVDRVWLRLPRRHRPARGPVRRATVKLGSTRLTTAMKRDGLSPNEDGYAEPGSPGWTIMCDPSKEQTCSTRPSSTSARTESSVAPTHFVPDRVPSSARPSPTPRAPELGRGRAQASPTGGDA
jgi:hypothetical protein